MGDDSRSGGIPIPILVALITVGGVLGAAVINKWDALFGAPAQPAAVAAVSPANITPPPRVRGPTAICADGTRIATNDPAVTACVARTPSATDLSGEWRDTDGYVFRFTQQGRSFRYAAFKDGAARGTGAGTIDGTRLRYGWRKWTGETGSCDGVLNPDGTINARCHDNGGGDDWGIYLVR